MDDPYASIAKPIEDPYSSIAKDEKELPHYPANTEPIVAGHNSAGQPIYGSSDKQSTGSPELDEGALSQMGRIIGHAAHGLYSAFTAPATDKENSAGMSYPGRVVNRLIVDPQADMAERAKGELQKAWSEKDSNPEDGSAEYVKGIGHGVAALVPGVGPLVANMAEEGGKQLGAGNYSGAVGTALTNAALLGAPKIIPKVVEGTTKATRAATRATLDIAHPSEEFGADGARALGEEGIVGTARGVKKGVNDALAKRVPERAAILAKSVTPLDIFDAVNNPFKDIRALKADPVTGVAQPESLNNLSKTQEVVNYAQDPHTGQPIPYVQRPLAGVTPTQADAIKSNIYGMTDYNPLRDSSLSNDALKGSAHGIKEAIDKAVPESVESSDRIHGLMAAKEGVKKLAKGEILSKQGMIKAGTQGGVTAANAVAHSLATFFREHPNAPFASYFLGPQLDQR